jgi:hypothetical protein
MQHNLWNIKIYHITSSAHVCSNSHSCSTDSSVLLTGSVLTPVFSFKMCHCVAERDFVIYHLWNDGSKMFNCFTDIYTKSS